MARLIRACDGWQHVEAALAAKRSLLFVTPHLGAYDIAGRYLSSRLPFPLTAMPSPAKLKWLEPLMNASRYAGNSKNRPATAQGVRQLFKTLRSGEGGGILPDQAPGEGGGVWAPFFGKPAYTMTLPARMAESTDAAVLFFGERLPFGRGYKVHIRPLQGPHSAVHRNTMPIAQSQRRSADPRIPGAISVELQPLQGSRRRGQAGGRRMSWHVKLGLRLWRGVSLSAYYRGGRDCPTLSAGCCSPLGGRVTMINLRLCFPQHAARAAQAGATAFHAPGAQRAGDGHSLVGAGQTGDGAGAGRGARAPGSHQRGSRLSSSRRISLA